MNALLESLSTWMPVLLRTSLQAALLVAVILVAQWVFAKRLSPAWRHALWGLVVVRLLMIWAPASPLSVYNLAVREVPVVAMEAPAITAHTEVPTVPESPVPPDAALATEPKGSRDFSDGRDSRTWGSYVNGVDFWAAASLVWLGVFGALLLAMAGQSLHFGRQVRRGRIVTDSGTLELLEECRATLRVSPFLALVETDCVRSPALLGCVRPKLLLPCGFLDTLSREEMRHVFLHELAHVKRGDIWSGWLFNLLLAAHWFNPAIWFARRRFIADREAACDAHVLAALDATGQHGYGHTVLNLTQRFNASPWAPGMAGISETNSNLKRRITMIKQFRPPTRLAAWSGAGLCMCIGLATLTNAQDVKPAAGDIVCEISDVYGYTATNGGTMIAAQLTNTGTQDVTVDVEFWEGGIDSGNKIGRGGLVVPAGKTATEAIPWAVENGTHAIFVRIDPENTVSEADEENNRVEAAIEYTDGRFRQLLLENYAEQVERRTSDKLRTELPKELRSSHDPTTLDVSADRLAEQLAVIAELQKDPSISIYEFGIETKVNEDPRVSVLQTEIAKLETEVDVMSLTYIDSHPTLKTAVAKLEILQKNLAKQSSRVREYELASLGASLAEQLKTELDASAKFGRSHAAPKPDEVTVKEIGSGTIDTPTSLEASQPYANTVDNMKQLGLIFKMFAHESKGDAFPPLSREPGRLMFGWENDGHTYEAGGAMSVKNLTDLAYLGCADCDVSSEVPDDTDFAYLGYLMRNDDDVRRFAEAYEKWATTDGGKGTWFTDDRPRGPDKGIARLREGVERFLITDINNPAGAALAQSQIPVLIEWPDRHATSSGQPGGNVLFMDGHVEFMIYPGKWPMTEETIGILCKLAGREPIKKLE